jgi:hypothetical protein
MMIINIEYLMLKVIVYLRNPKEKKKEFYGNSYYIFS